VVAGIVLAMIPATRSLPASVTLGLLAAVLVGLIAYESLRYAESRDHVRHRLAHGG
jgi:hypothetical protein